ncbi:MAG: flagellar filament capping protein FliD [Oscillospiraceae bacterium]
MSSISNFGSKRIGGLASGMNTDEIVKGMLANSQNKINKQYRNKQSILWKQDSYREIIRSVNSFKNKWFNVLDSKNNMGSPAFWQTTSASTTSKNFTVNSTSGASNTKLTVDYIEQLATKETINGNSGISGDIQMSTALTDANFTEIKQVAATLKDGEMPYLNVTVDGVTKKINYDFGKYDSTLKEFVDKDGKVMTKEAVQSNMVSTLQDSLNQAFGKGKVTFEGIESGVLTGKILVSGSSKATIYNGNMKGVEYFGLENWASNKINLGESIGNLGKNISGGTFEFDINGTNFKFSNRDSLSTVMSKINASTCGVKMSYSEFSDSFKMTSTADGAGSSINIKQKTGDLFGVLFGTKSGSQLSSVGLNGAISSTQKMDLSQVKKNISSPFQVSMIDENGKEITKTISIPARDSRGHEIDYSKYDANQIRNLLNTEINKAFDTKKFNVTLAEGNLSISHSDGTEITLKASGKDSQMLGFLGFANGATNKVESTTTMEKLGITENQSWLVNGKEINFTKDQTVADVMKLVNDDPTVKAKMELVNGKLLLTGTEQGNLSITTKTGTDKVGLYSLFGTTEFQTTQNDNYVSTTDKLSSLGITENSVIKVAGTDVTLTPNMTINQVMDAINAVKPNTVTLDKGAFKFAEEVSTVSGNALQKLFGNNKVIGDQSIKVTRNVKGQNAILSINGERIERSSNTVLVDGVEITATNVTSEKASINVTANVEDTVKKVKEFIEDYNKMIDSAKGKLNEKVYKDYQPLTEEQKKEMTKEQIEQWDEKAKSGALKNDQSVNSLLQDLRTAMYQPSAGGLALYDIGITTGDYSDGGKLKFADNLKNGKTGEDVLREMLSTNSEQVVQMFTSSETGFADRIKKITDDAVSTTISNRGYLANIAGLEGTFSDSDNLLSKQVTSIEQTIKKYQRSMEAEEKRYWAKFTQLEKLVSQMNAQSSWLTEQMG